MKKILVLFMLVMVTQNALAYNQSIVNVTMRTDGSDLGQRGIDTIVKTAKQANTSNIGALVNFMLYVGSAILLLYVFKMFLGGPR
jgi:hypothetical protein